MTAILADFAAVYQPDFALINIFAVGRHHRDRRGVRRQSAEEGRQAHLTDDLPQRSITAPAASRILCLSTTGGA